MAKIQLIIDVSSVKDFVKDEEYRTWVLNNCLKKLNEQFKKTEH